jgi:hypothetical protein
MVIVPVRGVAEVLGATWNVTVPLPAPFAGELIVSQPALLEAAQLQSGAFMVIPTVPGPPAAP